MVDEPVGDARLVGDVGDAAGVEALAREHAHGGVEDRRGACRPPPGRRVAIGVDLRAASRRPAGRRWVERRQLGADVVLRVEVEVGDDRASRRRAPARARGPRGPRSSSARRSDSRAGARRSGWRATTKHWFSIARARSSGSQWSRVVASVKARGDGDDPRAPRRRARGRARGSAGRSRRSARARAVGELGATTSSPGLLVVGLAVDGARRPRRRTGGSCGRPRGSRRRGRRGRSCCDVFSLALDALDDRAGDEVDAQLAGDRARPGDRGGRRAAGRRAAIARAEHAPLLRQHDELAPSRRGVAHQAIGGGEVARRRRWR